MKIYLLHDNERTPLTSHDEYATAEGYACPHCGKLNLSVQGSGKHPSADDRAWEAYGYSTCCKKYVGTIRCEVDTLFGVREDQAVLNGRCRVY